MNEFTHSPPTEHEVYLLRVWHEADGDALVWRASLLLPPGVGRRYYFATPDALLDFLKTHLREENRT